MLRLVRADEVDYEPKVGGLLAVLGGEPRLQEGHHDPLLRERREEGGRGGRGNEGERNRGGMGGREWVRWCVGGSGGVGVGGGSFDTT